MDKTNRIFGKRLPNDLKVILSALDPFKQSLAGVVVESTFNWYWLVDALQDNGYRVFAPSANPSAFSQYAGLKHTDDKSDAYWLAHMYRLGIRLKAISSSRTSARAGYAAQTHNVRPPEDIAHSQPAEHNQPVSWLQDALQRSQTT